MENQGEKNIGPITKAGFCIFVLGAALFLFGPFIFWDFVVNGQLEFLGPASLVFAAVGLAVVAVGLVRDKVIKM